MNSEQFSGRLGLAIDFLQSVHVQDNLYRLGALGAGDIQEALGILQRIRAAVDDGQLLPDTPANDSDSCEQDPSNDALVVCANSGPGCGNCVHAIPHAPEVGEYGPMGDDSKSCCHESESECVLLCGPTICRPTPQGTKECGR